jgi:hypothetical protein
MYTNTYTFSFIYSDLLDVFRILTHKCQMYIYILSLFLSKHHNTYTHFFCLSIAIS